MIAIYALHYWGRGVLQLVARLGRYLIIFLWGLCQPKAALVARTLALQSQLASCLEQIEKKEAPKPQFHPAFPWDEVIPTAVDGPGSGDSH